MNDLLIDSADGVMTITLSRLEKKNAFTQDMYQKISEVLNQSRESVDVRVVIIQGHETVFSAGNDINDFLGRSPSGVSAVLNFLTSISTFPKPLVAAVCGPAVGIGTTMLFHFDLIYAGDNAAFSMPFVNLGICPEAGSSYLAPRMMGFPRAAEALLLGEPFLAESALEMGFINRIVPPREAASLAQRQAQKLADKPLGSLLATKRLMKKGQDSILAERIKAESDTFAMLLQEPAAREAFSAFLEKRKPNFSKM